MKIIESKLIPFESFSAIMVLGILFVKDKTKVTPRKIRHEKIYVRQMLEINSLFFMILMALVTGLSLSGWWLLLSVFAYYIVYILCWIIELVLPPYHSAYRNICLETEAFYKERDETYLKSRKPFAFLKYISNKKYSYPK